VIKADCQRKRSSAVDSAFPWTWASFRITGITESWGSPQGLWFSKSWVEPKTCISNWFPGDADAAERGTAFWEPLLLSHQESSKQQVMGTTILSTVLFDILWCTGSCGCLENMFVQRISAVTALHIYITFAFPVISWMSLRLIPCFSYYKYCCVIMCVQMPLETPFTSFDHMLRCGIAESYGDFNLSFYGKIILFHQCMNSVIFPLSEHKGFKF
jgi:hypothetical protein